MRRASTTGVASLLAASALRRGRLRVTVAAAAALPPRCNPAQHAVPANLAALRACRYGRLAAPLLRHCWRLHAVSQLQQQASASASSTPGAQVARLQLAGSRMRTITRALRCLQRLLRPWSWTLAA